MIEISEAGRQLAADLANAESSGRASAFVPRDFELAYMGKALARLATQSISDKAHTEALEAQLAEAKADLAEIAELTKGNCTVAGGAQAFQIAAKHRVETDPLVEAFDALGWDRNSKNGDRIERLRAELAKRGIELAVKS